MRENWMGELIGQMHNAGVSRKEIAAELGVTPAYVTMLLNGIRTPEGAEMKLRSAFETVREKRKV